VGRRVRDEFETLLARIDCEHVDRGVQQLLWIGLGEIEFDLARFEFRVVEDVVDDAAAMPEFRMVPTYGVVAESVGA
jgi:hypothetical protein